MTRVGRSVVWTLLVGALWATDASAQIYMGRDAAGGIVLSDRPLVGSDVTTYAVARSGYRTTRAVTGASLDDRQPAGARFDDLIERHAADHGVRPELVRAVIQVESGFNPRARSVKGAMGLMQLMPATAEELGVTNPWDPAQNIRGGVAYLAQLLARFDDERLALAAYNAGPGAVERYGQQVPPYRETQDYVRKVESRTDIVASSGRGARRPIYRVWDDVDGRQVMRLTDVRPTSGAYDVLSR